MNVNHRILPYLSVPTPVSQLIWSHVTHLSIKNEFRWEHEHSSFQNILTSTSFPSLKSVSIDVMHATVLSFTLPASVTKLSLNDQYLFQSPSKANFIYNFITELDIYEVTNVSLVNAVKFISKVFPNVQKLSFDVTKHYTIYDSIESFHTCSLPNLQVMKFTSSRDYDNSYNHEFILFPLVIAPLLERFELICTHEHICNYTIMRCCRDLQTQTIPCTNTLKEFVISFPDEKCENKNENSEEKIPDNLLSIFKQLFPLAHISINKF